MRILVTASGRYGSTQEIAEAVGETIANHGHDTDVVPASDVNDVSGYDAVVMGGAIYAGQWLRDGRELIDRIGADLKAMPLWVFSSGPVGEGMEPMQPLLMQDALDPLDPKDHAVFGGKIDRDKLSIGDSAIAHSLRAADGDYRDWDSIRAWADKVAAEIGELS